MARALRSPETKARDALALADRKVARLDARLAKAVVVASAIDSELQAAVVERDYAAANPALHMDTLTGVDVDLGGNGVLETEETANV